MSQPGASAPRLMMVAQWPPMINHPRRWETGWLSIRTRSAIISRAPVGAGLVPAPQVGTHKGCPYVPIGCTYASANQPERASVRFGDERNGLHSTADDDHPSGSPYEMSQPGASAPRLMFIGCSHASRNNQPERSRQGADEGVGNFIADGPAQVARRQAGTARRRGGLTLVSRAKSSLPKQRLFGRG